MQFKKIRTADKLNKYVTGLIKDENNGCRLGQDVTTLAYDVTSFRIQTEVSASQTFFGWVFGFGGKLQIPAPESVKEQYRQMIERA